MKKYILKLFDWKPVGSIKLIFPDKDEIREQLYKIIRNKKYTTSMLQKFFIRFIYEPEKLIDNIKMFEELINMCSDKDPNMFL